MSTSWTLNPENRAEESSTSWEAILAWMKNSPFARQTLGVLVSEAGTNCLHHSPGGEILWGNELQTPELPALLTLNYGVHIRVRLPERRIGKLQCRSWNQKKRKNPIKKGEFFSKHCSESFVIDVQAPCKKQQKQKKRTRKKKHAHTIRHWNLRGSTAADNCGSSSSLLESPRQTTAPISCSILQKRIIPRADDSSTSSLCDPESNWRIHRLMIPG